MRSLPLPSRDRKLSAKVVSLSLRQGGALGHGSIEKVTGVGRGEQGVDCVGSGRFPRIVTCPGLPANELLS